MSAPGRAMLRLLSAVLLATVCPALRAQVASLGPAHAPSDVKAVGDPGDESGEVVLVSWTSPQAPPPSGLKLVGYRLYRSTNDRPWVGLLERTEVPEAPPGSPAETATGKQWTWRRYRYRVAALYAPPGRLWYMQGEALPRKAEEGGKLVGPAVLAQEALSGPSLSSKTVTLTAGPWELPVETPTTYTQTVGRWYFTKRTNVLIGCVLYGFVVLWFIYHARRGKDIYIRPIAGIEALDDAIGRATEMGKPILYVSGLSSLGDISTITSMTILGRVARRTAEYETPLLVPCFDPLVMLAAREIVKEAYLDAGKPDAYREGDIFFVTDRQFAYVAGVDGIMLRERPAANLYMGYFFAEALILAETGAATGAIQIAGTDADTQIPFFVTSCDYTLMGEELYAATAYLAREPMLLAQLKAQDAGKLAVGGLLTVGAAAASVAAFLACGGAPWMKTTADFVTRCLDQLRAG